MVGTAGAIIITVLVLAAVAAIGWVGYSRWRAQKLGLPPPSFTSFVPFLKSDRSNNSYGGPGPRPGGIQGWFSDQMHKFKNRNNRTAAGAYEGGGGSSAATGRRGFGALDPDEAWDARVGNEADNYGPGGYYEEQELGLHDRGPYGRDNTAYDGAHHGGGGLRADPYPMNLAATPRTDEGFDAERGRGVAGRNPFDDDAAEPSNISLRGVSPRPMEAEHGQSSKQQQQPESPTERRSIFREGV
ncbi:hypothetical protein M406DRAFT_274183 [Cryphonectria parasitica EP155]|uniref:Acid phosphatase-like protein n=1 Tax=Cryphonectria parasitica (strain ATCC 38755 / EP155) TaxID=660469 RepID=A0A9P5CR61_CRYP1|nr:uncharacterized protein M406DRAFT_274183 [Cryphonectria parasitica EP155]KAF3766775.1 hypothetical protein M406DRAFT_274183 [Cryphonectria parasitica EP155]